MSRLCAKAIVLMLLPSSIFGGSLYGKNPMSGFISRSSQDTAYFVISDSVTESEFYFTLVYRHSNRVDSIVKIENKEGTIEIDHPIEFKNKIQFYDCFTIYHLVAGTSENIFFDKLNKRFFRTEMYDLSATGDSLLWESASFENRTAKVKRGVPMPDHSSEYYTIKLFQIWPAKK